MRAWPNSARSACTRVARPTSISKPSPTPWLASALDAARQELKPAARSATDHAAALRTSQPRRWSREQPFAAELLANQRLTGRGSRKDVRHLELSLEGSGLAYQPGDALGVWPRESAGPGATPCWRSAQARRRHARAVDGELPLREWLDRPARTDPACRARSCSAHAERSGSDALHPPAGPGRRPQLAQLLSTHQLIDVLQRIRRLVGGGPGRRAAPAGAAPVLDRVQRSRRSAREAHLTVDLRGLRRTGRPPLGRRVAPVGQRRRRRALPVFIEANERFRLPADGSRDIDHDRPRHRRRAVPRLRAGARRRPAPAAATGCSSATRMLRHDFLYQARVAASAQAPASCTASTSRSRATRPTRSTCRTALREQWPGAVRLAGGRRASLRLRRRHRAWPATCEQALLE